MSVRMDASAGRLQVGSGKQPAAGSPFTSMYWCWVDRNLSAAGSMLGRSNATRQWYHGYTSTYKHTFANGTSNAVGQIIPSNQWVHLACVKSGSWHGMYYNGLLDGTFFDANNPTNGILDMFRDSFNGFQYAGAIAYPRVWTRALSQQEIAAEMSSATPVNLSQIFNWTEFAAWVDNANDHSGLGNDWTVNTGTVVIELQPNPVVMARTHVPFFQKPPAVTTPKRHRSTVYGAAMLPAVVSFRALEWLRERKNRLQCEN